MASPIELLREGIASRNWDKIIQGYTGLTGSTPPAAARPAPLAEKKPNRFVDDGTIAKNQIKDSKKLSRQSKKAPPKAARPAFEEIDLTCCRCGKSQRVHPGLRPVAIDPDSKNDGRAPDFKCDRCVGR